MTSSKSVAAGKVVQLGVIVPLYNEEEVVPTLVDRLEQLGSHIPAELTFYLVDDGSSDATLSELSAWAMKNDRVKVISLSRNFGHQSAITAGLDHVSDSEDYVVIMDGDLQDPPEVIVEMLAKAEEGFDVVYAKRRRRDTDSWRKKITARVFYRLLNWLSKIEIPANVGDFRLISRKALIAFRALPEQHRFLRGMFSWIGFPQAEVLFDRTQREAGETKYPLRKMFSLAWNAVTSFSAVPLRIGMIPGFFAIVLGLGYCVYSLIRFIQGETVPGWTALVFLICLFGGSLLFAIWIIGEYIAKIFEEVKGRPHYLVKETKNLPNR